MPDVFLIKCSFPPVSYTHLDVYKRQTGVYVPAESIWDELVPRTLLTSSIYPFITFASDASISCTMPPTLSLIHISYAFGSESATVGDCVAAQVSSYNGAGINSVAKLSLIHI